MSDGKLLTSTMQARHPARFARVRSSCGHAASGINLDHHAALIVKVIEERSAAMPFAPRWTRRVVA